MDSFKVYLPSNASTQLYPSNSPSDYRTRLDQPINVDGDWEVGIESVFYSPNFQNEGEKARIDFVNVVTSITVNSIYPYELITGSISRGIGAVMPKHAFESNGENLWSVLKTINSINDLILNPSKKKTFGEVFDFHLVTTDKVRHIVYTSYDRGFTLEITPKLASYMGFGKRTTFSGPVSVKGEALNLNKMHSKEKHLSREDYKIQFLNTKLLQKKIRITIKRENEAFDGTEKSFLAMWSERVKNKYNIVANFQGDKLMIHTEDDNLVVCFSSDFSKTFGYDGALFGKNAHWSDTPHKMEKGLTSQVWYIDVFSDQYELTDKVSHYNLFTNLYPWKYRDHQELYTYINQTVQTYLKSVLLNKYDSSSHSFALSLQNDNQCQLTLGKWLDVSFSKNLSYLLGFPENIIIAKELNSVREVTALTYSKQQLFLLSDVIKPTAIGNHRLQILQDFLHNPTGVKIIEKRFDPMVYLPVMTNYMDTINIQLTDESFKPIPIKDSKTIVTLYFRKVKAT